MICRVDLFLTADIVRLGNSHMNLGTTTAITDTVIFSAWTNTESILNGFTMAKLCRLNFFIVIRAAKLWVFVRRFEHGDGTTHVWLHNEVV